MSNNISIENVMKALSDQKTQRLFKSIIEAENVQSQILIGGLGLSRRQYYNRIKALTGVGLIRRQRGKYRLTSFGKIIYSLQKIAEKSVSNYWKLEAIDSIMTSENSNLAEVDYMKIIDILLDDVEMKNFFLHGDESKIPEIDNPPLKLKHHK